MAWPISALVIVAVVVANFRTQIRALLARMKTVKVAGGEATFADEITELRSVAEVMVEEKVEERGEAQIPEQSRTTPPELAEQPDRDKGTSPLNFPEGDAGRDNLPAPRSMSPAAREILNAWDKLDNGLLRAFNILMDHHSGKSSSVRLTTVSYRLHHLANHMIVTPEAANTILRLKDLARDVRSGRVQPTIAEGRDFGWTALSMATVVELGLADYLDRHPELSTEKTPE